MFEDFEFEEKKFNPWNVQSLEEFRYYCCPECPSKNVNKTDFIKHAVISHPESQSTIERLEDNKAGIKTKKPDLNQEEIKGLGQNDENELFDDFEFEDKFDPWDVKSLEKFRCYCCPECPSKYVNKTDFIKHVVTVHPQSQSTIESLEDNKAVIKTENTSSRVELHTNDDEILTHNSVEASEEKETFASIVKRFFPTAPDFQLLDVQPPKNIHECVRYNCDKCDENFSRKSELTEHINRVHEKIRYNCNQCEKSFSHKGTLKTHIESVHEDVQYNCDKCEKSFYRESYLKRHIKRLHEKRFVTDKAIECAECGKPFECNADYKKHYYGVHLEKHNL